MAVCCYIVFRAFVRYLLRAEGKYVNTEYSEKNENTIECSTARAMIGKFFIGNPSRIGEIVQDISNSLFYYLCTFQMG